MFEKRAQTAVPIEDLIALRWSGRAYDSHRPVERQKLIAFMEAARWAPSCYGDQPWRFLVWDRAADTSNWRRAFECLVEGNQRWARDAPILLLAMADNAFGHNDQPNRWGAYDTGAASMSLSLQATALGLMVHQMGGFDAARIQTEFGIPPRFSCLAMMTVGYQMSEVEIPEELREREYAPRHRRRLDETFFWGEWQKSWE